MIDDPTGPGDFTTLSHLSVPSLLPCQPHGELLLYENSGRNRIDPFQASYIDS